ncbi:MAG: 50S ribosomal protein L15 [Candidatus Aenigmarchaeota archaeon]|nr:50S ribosomal protein L15 [Candidatus Aenigmarchaeota archaeon]
MVVRKKRKITKKRGQRSPGYGSQKKHRGGGSRGGRGLAGLHKHKRLTALKYMPGHYGKRGFKRPQKSVKEIKVINIKQIDSQLEDMLKEGKIQKEKGFYIVNLNELGYDKLLGTGKVTHKMIVEAKSFSESARKKIEEANGKARTV